MRLTRKQLAMALLKRVRRGPSFGGFDLKGDSKLHAEAKAAYRLWSTSHIIADLIRLVPELKGIEPDRITDEPAAD